MKRLLPQRLSLLPELLLQEASEEVSVAADSVAVSEGAWEAVSVVVSVLVPVVVSVVVSLLVSVVVSVVVSVEVSVVVSEEDSVVVSDEVSVVASEEASVFVSEEASDEGFGLSRGFGFLL